MRESAAVLARLRQHCNGGGSPCRECDPPTARYCSVALPEAAGFADLRRHEVAIERIVRRTDARLERARR